MNEGVIGGIFDWIKDDFKSNRLRFAIEVLAWAISIVPNPPLLALYPVAPQNHLHSVDRRKRYILVLRILEGFLERLGCAD